MERPIKKDVDEKAPHVKAMVAEAVLQKNVVKQVTVSQLKEYILYLRDSDS